LLTLATLKTVVPTLARKEAKQEIFKTHALRKKLVIAPELKHLEASGKSTLPAMPIRLAIRLEQVIPLLESLHLIWLIAATPKVSAKMRRSRLSRFSVLAQLLLR
jgi:hypothetical protein